MSHTFVNLHNVFNIYEPTADLRACIKSHSGCNIEKEPLKNQITSFKEKSDQVNEDKNLLSKHLEKLVCNPIIDDCKFLSNNVQTFLLVSITILYPAKL